jgi:hypothetical protein
MREEETQEIHTFEFNPVLKDTVYSVFEEEPESVVPVVPVMPVVSPIKTPSGSGVQLSEKCYLCMNNIIENAKDIVIMRCSERCGTRLHFSCVVKGMWPQHLDSGIICPVCTKDEHLHRAYGPAPPLYRSTSPSLYTTLAEKDSTKGDYRFLCKIRSMLVDYLGWSDLRTASEEDLKAMLLGIRQCVNKKAGMISGSGKISRRADMSAVPTNKVMRKWCERAAVYLIQEIRLSSLLDDEHPIACIHRYITDRFEGLLLMGLCMDDLKTMERNNDIGDFVRLYQVNSPKLRSYLGEDQMCLKNLIRIQLSAESMEALGILLHELCVMNLSQEDMQHFPCLVMEDWIFRLKMTPTCLQVLRIKARDIDHPEGKLHKLGWEMVAFDRYMNLSKRQKDFLKLRVTGPHVAEKSRAESFASAASKASPAVVNRTKDQKGSSPSPPPRVGALEKSWRSNGRKKTPHGESEGNAGRPRNNHKFYRKGGPRGRSYWKRPSSPEHQ